VTAIALRRLAAMTPRPTELAVDAAHPATAALTDPEDRQG